MPAFSNAADLLPGRRVPDTEASTLPPLQTPLQPQISVVSTTDDHGFAVLFQRHPEHAVDIVAVAEGDNTGKRVSRNRNNKQGPEPAAMISLP